MQNLKGRVTYPELDAPLRTDSSFRDRTNPVHYNKDGRTSIMENIIVDLVNDVHFYYMHLVCIGSYKKLLLIYFAHPFENIPLTKGQLAEIPVFEFIFKSTSLPSLLGSQERLNMLVVGRQLNCIYVL